MLSLVFDIIIPCHRSAMRAKALDKLATYTVHCRSTMCAKMLDNYKMTVL